MRYLVLVLAFSGCAPVRYVSIADLMPAEPAIDNAYNPIRPVGSGDDMPPGVDFDFAAASMRRNDEPTLRLADGVHQVQADVTEKPLADIRAPIAHSPTGCVSVGKAVPCP